MIYNEEIFEDAVRCGAGTFMAFFILYAPLYRVQRVRDRDVCVGVFV